MLYLEWAPSIPCVFLLNYLSYLLFLFISLLFAFFLCFEETKTWIQPWLKNINFPQVKMFYQTKTLLKTNPQNSLHKYNILSVCLQCWYAVCLPTGEKLCGPNQSSPPPPPPSSSPSPSSSPPPPSPPHRPPALLSFPLSRLFRRFFST